MTPTEEMKKAALASLDYFDINSMLPLTQVNIETIRAVLQPSPQVTDDDVDKIMNMTEDQIKAALLLDGRCPNCAANETKATILQTLYDHTKKPAVPQEVVDALNGIEPLLDVDCPDMPAEDSIGWQGEKEIPVTFGQVRAAIKALRLLNGGKDGW